MKSGFSEFMVIVLPKLKMEVKLFKTRRWGHAAPQIYAFSVRCSPHRRDAPRSSSPCESFQCFPSKQLEEGKEEIGGCLDRHILVPLKYTVQEPGQKSVEALSSSLSSQGVEGEGGAVEASRWTKKVPPTNLLPEASCFS